MGGERGWRWNQSPVANDLILRAYGMKPLQKTPKEVGFEDLLGWGTRKPTRDSGPQTLQGRKPLCWGPCPVYLLICC